MFNNEWRRNHSGYGFFQIRTAGSAGGLFCPYKGLLPATSQDVLNEFANRTFFTH